VNASDAKMPPEARRKSAAFLTGLAFVVGYILVSAAGEVYAASAFQSSDIYTTLLIAFVIIMVVFNLLPRHTRGMPTQQQVRAILALNAATTVAWLGLFIGLKYVEPAIVVSFMVALGPIATAVSNFVIRGISPSRRDVIASLLIVIAGIYLVAVIWVDMGGMSWNTYSWVGLLASLLAGSSLAVTGVFVKRLYDLNMDGRAILANRFYLTVIVLLFLVDFTVLRQQLTDNALQALLIALSTLIVPVILIQLGIKRLEPITVNLLLCSAPMVTFLMQMFDSRLAPSLATLAGNIVIVAVAIWAVRAHASQGA